MKGSHMISKISKIRNTLVGITALLALAVPTLAPVAVYAEDVNIQDSLCQGVNLEASGTCDATAEGETAATNVSALLKRVINIFSIFVGVIAVIMIIVGGLKYITSGGDSGNVSSAKNTILYALVGLVIVALAQFIVRFVLGQASGLDG